MLQAYYVFFWNFLNFLQQFFQWKNHLNHNNDFCSQDDEYIASICVK